MRELVYLSEAKLRAFMIKRRKRWLGRAQVAAEVGLPGVGGLKISPAAPETRHQSTPALDEVINALVRSRRSPRQFGNELFLPGEWMRFHARMSFVQSMGTVLFLSARPDDDEFSRSNRLLLHGSSQHLLTLARGNENVLVSNGNSKLLRMLRVNDPRLRYALKWVDGSSHSYESRGARSMMRVIADLESLLSLKRTAAWMAGFARVTAIAPAYGDGDIVIASPLYVEYAQPPED